MMIDSKKRRRVLIVATVSGAALIAAPAIARHSWSNYHWERTTDTELTIPVVDNTTPNGNGWPAKVAIAVPDWNKSLVIESPLENGNAPSDCAHVPGTIQVCNDAYGPNGWLGIASIMLDGSHIIAGVTQLNDTYFSQARYATDTWRQLVTCQEIGHNYGLGHQNENFNNDRTESCMEYTSWPEGNEHPDAHDYEELESIYSHIDGSGGSTGGNGNGKPDKPPKGPKRLTPGNGPAAWGKAVAFMPDGRPNVFSREEDGYTIVTHVTWAIGEGPHGRPHFDH